MEETILQNQTVSIYLSKDFSDLSPPDKKGVIEARINEIENEIAQLENERRNLNKLYSTY